MSTTTPNLELNKPDGTDFIDISVLNSNFDKIDSAFARTAPVGSIVDFAGNTIPSGYLECDGSAVSRTTYAKLFAVIGTTWGAGNGSTTFNLPNFGGRVTIGKGSRSVGNTGGEETHVLTPGETATKNHTHTLNSHTHTINSHYHWFSGSQSHSHKPDDTNYVFMAYKIGGGVTRSRVENGTDSYVFRTPTQSDLGWAYNTNNATVTISGNTNGSGTLTSNGSGTLTTNGQTAANGSAHNNMQPYAVVRKIIRAI